MLVYFFIKNLMKDFRDKNKVSRSLNHSLIKQKHVLYINKMNRSLNQSLIKRKHGLYKNKINRSLNRS